MKNKKIVQKYFFSKFQKINFKNINFSLLNFGKDIFRNFGKSGPGPLPPPKPAGALVSETQLIEPLVKIYYSSRIKKFLKIQKNNFR